MVARLVAGDDAALAAIYDQYSSLVHGVAVRMVGHDSAVDVCQEVFTTLWDHPDRFDPTRGTLRTFLAMVTRRRCIDQLRRTGRRADHEQRSGATATSVPDVEEAAIALLAGERVRVAMAALPEAQRRAIELAYFGGLTFKEVAVRTGASEGTTKSRIRLGLQRLAAELAPNSVEPR
jgi:RNA polymerase sigma-70 factor (ECF subfamily)